MVSSFAGQHESKGLGRFRERRELQPVERLRIGDHRVLGCSIEEGNLYPSRRAAFARRGGKILRSWYLDSGETFAVIFNLSLPQAAIRSMRCASDVS